MAVVMAVVIMTVMAVAAYGDDNLRVRGGEGPSEEDNHDETKDPA